MGRLDVGGNDPNLLVGANTLDDAGVYRIAPDLALVQTLDFFPPIVDDPYDYGRIAATNALSDVYAMGGTPLTAMNIVGFPDKDLDIAILGEILRGGADVMRAAGAVLVGGHSVRDSEVKYGLSVTGRVDPRRMLTNAAARPGDRLILTKPIGSGTLTTAAKSGRIEQGELAACIESMATLNRVASEVALRHGVVAATDITGFGLIGHASNIALGSRVGITIEAGSVPLFDRALELAREGVLTRAHRQSREYLGDRLVAAAHLEPALVGLLLDAQTSGGMLLAVEESRSAGLLAELHAAGVAASAVIGRVEAGPAGRVCVE